MARRFLAAVVLVLLGAAPSLAGEPADRLRTFFERANRIILAPELEGGVEERVTAVRALVNGIFDFDGASALALGRHWEPLPPPARAAFTRLYADVIERAYLAWVGGKARVGEGGVSIRWLGEAVEHDAAAVSSLLLTRTGGEFPIEYRMVRRANDWRVRDVVVDGVSLAANYHVQFERVLQLGSYDELVDRLREKAGPVARAQATASAVRAMVAAPAPVGPPPRVVATPAAPDPPSAAAVIVAEVRAPMTGVVATRAASPPSSPTRPNNNAPRLRYHRAAMTPLREVVAVFLRLGLVAFGGPAAHIALMREELVRRRRWLSDAQFVDLLGITNLIPGPNSTEMAIHLGYTRAGAWGLVLGGVCFIVPAMLSVMALAWAYVRWGTLPAATWLLYGVKPVIIAIVLQAMWALAPTAVRGPLLAVAFVAAAALALAGVHELLVLFGVGGLTALAVARSRPAAAMLAALAWATPGRALAAAAAAA